MAKPVKAIVKLQIAAGKANPAPPIGPVLGQHGVNIMGFCTEYNAKTKDMGDMIIPVELTIYIDRTFSFVLKTPPVSNLIKKAISIQKGSAEPNKNKVGVISMEQIKEIALIKLPDLNADNLDAAVKIIMGSARSMGVEVK
ncbi:MAG: 50S ribosomal protein L11 [Candidatus Margulisiibacteriota bacterium]|jgi:large subunit ribosomal protein L11